MDEEFHDFMKEITQEHTLNVDPSRSARFTVLLASTAAVLVTTPALTGFLGSQFFDNGTMVSISTALGLAAAIGAIPVMLKKFFVVENGPTGVFVTQDAFASLQGRKQINVPYGPGVHISFPWERRLAGNNILIEDYTSNFEFVVQRPDGTLYGKGSYRMRPDRENLIAFLSSVAAVGEEIRDLIIAEIQSYYKEGTAMDGLGSLGELNGHLKRTLGDGKHSEVEQRNGVHISDVTVSELLPNDELRRTINAISEAKGIHQGIEIMLGLSKQEIDQRIAAGTLTQADLNLARDRFLAISGNLDGMDIKRHEIDVSVHGLDSEAIKALSELGKSPAAAAAIAAGASGRTGGKGKGNS